MPVPGTATQPTKKLSLLSHAAFSILVDSLAAGIPGLQIVPKLNVLLALFPAEENLFPVSDRRKIDQPTIQVFDLDLAHVELKQDTPQISHDPNPGIYQRPAEVISALHELLQFFFLLLKVTAEGEDTREPLTNVRQEGSRLVTSVVLAKLARHAAKISGRDGLWLSLPLSLEFLAHLLIGFDG